MQNYVPYTRSVRVTFADGTKRTVKSRPTLQLEGSPLTEMPEDVKESWLRMNWPQPVTDIRFVYRKRG